MARPSRLTPKLRERIVHELADGVPVNVTAQRVGVPVRTLHSWLASGKVERQKRLEPSPVAVAPDLDARLRQAVPALVGTILAASQRGSWQSAAWLLERVDQRKLSVTADTYTHVMADSREADYEELVGV